jgi:hypothetical protein
MQTRAQLMQSSADNRVRAQRKPLVAPTSEHIMPNRNTSDPKATPEKPRADNEAAQKPLKGETKKKWDIIDEHAWESFPASDAPASWAGRDISPADREAAEERKKQQN